MPHCRFGVKTKDDAGKAPGPQKEFNSWELWLTMLFVEASQVVERQRIHLPMHETRVWSLGREDPLEEEMATHSSILT